MFCVDDTAVAPAIQEIRLGLLDRMPALLQLQPMAIVFSPRGSIF